jgi:homoserine O-acetyltransferase
MGNYSTISDFGELVSEDKSFNDDDYFFISITSLGFPGSCSPSTSGLNHDFPNYEIEDLVNFQRQLLKEKFPNVKKLQGIVGYSFGGFIALGWSIFYPDDMDFVIHFNSSFKAQGNKYIFAKLANQIIEDSGQYFSDIYNESISNVLILVSQLHYILSFSNDYINSLSIEEINFSIENFADEILFFDIHDIKVCNDFLLSFNLENLLDRIKCKLLVIGVGNNNYYIPEYDSIPLHELVEGSEYLFLDTEYNPNELEYLYKIEKDIKNFVDSV